LLFPPQTRELQLDEKWAFVLKKQAHCDLENPDDHTAGDCWDHVAFDPEHRLVLGVVFGKRSSTKILTLLKQVNEQLERRVPQLVTSDEFSAYATVLKLVWPEAPAGRQDPRCTHRGRKCLERTGVDADLNYATVCKERKNGRVVSVTTTVVCGTAQSVAEALEASTVSNTINTSFVERHNGTDRHHNARKARRTYRFSKDWEIHQAVGHFTMYSYNFCWPVRTLAELVEDKTGSGRKRRPRTPAMAAGLTDHVWPLKEWLECPVAGISN
jgi:IS1 family transposase